MMKIIIVAVVLAISVWTTSWVSYQSGYKAGVGNPVIIEVPVIQACTSVKEKPSLDKLYPEAINILGVPQ